MSYYFQNTESDCKHTDNSVYTFKILNTNFELKWGVLIVKNESDCNINPNLDDANKGIGCDISFDTFDITKTEDTIVKFKVHVYFRGDQCDQNFECTWDEIPSKLKQIKSDLNTAFGTEQLNAAYDLLQPR